MSEIDDNFVEQKSLNLSSVYDTMIKEIIPNLPTMTAINNIKFDFNYGMRIFFPDNYQKYFLSCQDIDTGIYYYNDQINNSNSSIISLKKYFINYKIVIKNQENEVVFTHQLNLKNQDVLIFFPVPTLGDSIAWFSYIEKFQRKHGCNIYICMNEDVQEILKPQYSDYKFLKQEELKNHKFYATYYLGLYMKDIKSFLPLNYKYTGLHKIAGMILGLTNKEELEETPPRLNLNAKRQIKEKYVVIATHATAQCKHWNNPEGWYEVIKFLRKNGYKILCIDKEPINGTGICFNKIPWGVEDYTGHLTLQERIDIIKDADFFIGLPSGLSWLAWACKIPVILISGFSLPYTEFYTPYRIINYSVCHGCWNDISQEFDNTNFLWCPYKEEDKEKFECTKYINAIQVINAIKTIPSFNNN